MYYQLPFKTGRYIVELIGDHPNGVLVQVIGVIFHPKQGDLHSPGDIDVFFHERKALAYKEKRVVSPNLLKPYTDEIPEYSDSLKNAVIHMETKLLAEDTPFNKKALETLNSLKKEYTTYYGIQF